MKKYIIFLIFFPTILYSQSDSLKVMLSYYPLQIGNYWEYLTYSEEIPYPPTDSIFYSIEVMGDTTLENGHKYEILLQKKIYPNNKISFNYDRIDSSTGCVYRYINDTTLNHEYKMYSLFAQPGDTINASRGRLTSFGYYRTSCLSVKIDTILGFTTQIKEFYDYSFFPGENYGLAEGLGLIYSSTCEFGCGLTSLVYAKINGKEYGTKITGVEKYNSPKLTFHLIQNYPNPFNPSTDIMFEIPKSGKVTIRIYDILGKEIESHAFNYSRGGTYKFIFNGSNYSSGIYFYQIEYNRIVQTKKMLLLK